MSISNSKSKERKRIDFTLSKDELEVIEKRRDDNGYSTNKDFLLDLALSRKTTDRRFNKQAITRLTNLTYLLDKSNESNSSEEIKSLICKASKEVEELWKALLKRPSWNMKKML